MASRLKSARLALSGRSTRHGKTPLGKRLKRAAGILAGKRGNPRLVKYPRTARGIAKLIRRALRMAKRGRVVVGVQSRK